jgi:hypothetical protein
MRKVIVCQEKLQKTITECVEKANKIKMEKRKTKLIEDDSIVFTQKPIRTVKIMSDSSIDISKYEKFKGNPKNSEKVHGFLNWKT